MAKTEKWNSERVDLRKLAGEPLRAGGFSAPPWIREWQRQSHEIFQKQGFPNRRLESWRFLNLEPLLSGIYEPARESKVFPDARRWGARGCGPELIFINGIFQKNELDGRGGGCGVSVRTWASGLGDQEVLLRPWIEKHLTDEQNPFVHLNASHCEDGVWINISKDAEDSVPIRFVFLEHEVGGRQHAYHPRIWVHLESGARARILCEYPGDSGSRAFMNLVMEFHLSRQSNLCFLGAEPLPSEGFHFSSLRFELEEESRLKMVQVQRGSCLSRTDVAVGLKGPKAAAALYGLSLLAGQEKSSQEMAVRHEGPKTQSSQVFKNILAGQSEAEFTSLARVSREARKSASHQINRNLLLSDDSRAVSRPRLQIDTDEVTADHGSATGEMDETELFYLQSRGLTRPQARFLLAYGFAEEILREIPDEVFKTSLESLLIPELKKLLETSGGELS